MSFQAGQPRPPGAGRRKGTPNKATEVKDICIRMGVDPIEFLCSVVAGSGEFMGVDLDVKDRVAAAKELASYIAPKLKQTNLTMDEPAGPEVPELDLSKLSTDELEQFRSLVSKATPERIIDGDPHHPPKLMGSQ